VRICRTVGTGALRNLDPFLMLDELRMPSEKASAGFPWHPHRGFETCSIMFTGKMEHQDSVGNKVSGTQLAPLTFSASTIISSCFHLLGHTVFCSSMRSHQSALPQAHIQV